MHETRLFRSNGVAKFDEEIAGMLEQIPQGEGGLFPMTIGILNEKGRIYREIVTDDTDEWAKIVVELRNIGLVESPGRGKYGAVFKK